MPTIFISYRREDNSDAAGRIFDRLAQHFGGGSVFFDIDTIPFGVDFREHIHDYVAKCDVVLVVIGDNWLCTDDDGNLRLNDAKDFVRIELEAALQRDIPVVPVLVGNAQVPSQSELPHSLHDLAFRNAAEVRSGTAFQGQIERLIRGIEELPETAKAAPEEHKPEPVKKAQPTHSIQPDRDGNEALVKVGFTALIVASVFFAVLIGAKLMMPEMNYLYMKIPSLLYFGAATVLCFMGLYANRRAQVLNIPAFILWGAGLGGCGMAFWSIIYNGAHITFDEIFPAWIIATACFGALAVTSRVNS